MQRTTRTTTGSRARDLPGTLAATAGPCCAAGYGYLVDQPVSGIVTPLASNPPFASAVSYNGAPIPVSNLYGNAQASGISLAMVNPKYSNAYVESYNLNLQQALPWGMVSSIYYVGSQGKHLLIQTNANQVVGTNSKTQVHPFTTSRGR